jgi:outer membrane protein
MSGAFSFYLKFTIVCYDLSKEKRIMKAFGFHIAVAALAGLVMPMLAHADTLPSQKDSLGAFVHIGIANVDLDDKGLIYAAGVPQAGATYSTNDTTPVVIEGGYFLTPTLAVQGSISSKETSRNTPHGTFEGQPDLGEDGFHVATLTLVCHPFRGQTVSPYFGFGAGFHIADGFHDGLVTDFHVKDTSGLALQAGADLKITRRIGLYIDLKKLFYTARASGEIEGTPVTSSARLDPVIIQGGVSLAF